MESRKGNAKRNRAKKNRPKLDLKRYMTVTGVAALSFMTIGVGITGIAYAEPPSYEEAALESVPETQPETTPPVVETPLAPTEPAVVETQPETPPPTEPATEPVTAPPETTPTPPPETTPAETQPVVTQPETTVTVPETTTPVPETTPVAQPETTAAVQETQTPAQPETAQPETVQQETATQPETTTVQQETATEQPTEEQTTATANSSQPQTGVPAVTVTSAYTPATISFINEEEIKNNISEFLKENDKTLSDTQKAILNACISTNPAPAGYCAQWVSNVYAAIGCGIGGNANDMWAAYCYSNNRDDLKPGMIVAVQRSNPDPNTWGYHYGHVGIYVGNGMVVDSTSRDGAGVKTLNTLDNWIAGYDVSGTVMWGYPAGIEDVSSPVEETARPDVQVTLDENRQIQLSWEEDPNAFGYILQRYDEPIANIRDNSVTDFSDMEINLEDFGIDIGEYMRSILIPVFEDTVSDDASLWIDTSVAEPETEEVTEETTENEAPEEGGEEAEVAGESEDTDVTAKDDVEEADAAEPEVTEEEQTAEENTEENNAQSSIEDTIAAAYSVIPYSMDSTMSSLLSAHETAETREAPPVIPQNTSEHSSTATELHVADVETLTSVPITSSNYADMVAKVPNMTKEELVALGIEMYGVDSRWMQMLIGTTCREGYLGDHYLYYAWACEILNTYRGFSADAMYARMDGWGSAGCAACGEYYGEHAVLYGCGMHASYSTTPDFVLKAVYLAMINRDFRIAEVDGMINISNPPGGYALIYNSPVYNCQVWAAG